MNLEGHDLTRSLTKELRDHLENGRIIRFHAEPQFPAPYMITLQTHTETCSLIYPGIPPS